MKTNSFIQLHNIGSIHRNRTCRDNFLQIKSDLPRWFYNRRRACRDDLQLHNIGSIHRSRTCRDDFLQIGAELAEMTLYQSEQNLPRCHNYIHRVHSSEQNVPIWHRLISLPTYFMVAGALTKNCFHRILSYLSIFTASSMPSCSTDVTLHHTNTTPRVYTLPWPNQPIHQAPLRRLQTASLLKPWRYQWLVICRPLLSNEYYSEETNHKSSWHPPGTLNYRPVSSVYPILWLQCTIASNQRYTKDSCNVRLLTCAHVAWGGLFICLLFDVYLLDIQNSNHLRSHFTFLVAQHVSIHSLFRMGGSD